MATKLLLAWVLSGTYFLDVELATRLTLRSGRPDLLEHYLVTYPNILFIPGAADGGQLQESMKRAYKEFNSLGQKVKGKK